METPRSRHGAAATKPTTTQHVLRELYASGDGRGAEESRASHANATSTTNPILDSIRTSLSLLEMILRLTSLQQFQQQSHLAITDELLNFFLAESSTTGAGGDEHHRQRLRADARRKVGWDPYDESPLKVRGEGYQSYEQAQQQWAAE
ncbi:hypothetical protein KEM52_004754, partial [Ascosphaera acerosa]